MSSDSKSVCQSGCTALLISFGSLQVTRPRANPTPTSHAFLPAYFHTKRWRMQGLWTSSHWDKAGPLLTRPQPSARILPPTSIDYVVGGRAVSLAFFFFLSYDFNTATGYPWWCSSPSPNDIFTINCRLHGHSVMWAWHNQWRLPYRTGHFLLLPQRPDRLGIGCADPSSTSFDLTVQRHERSFWSTFLLGAN